MVYSGYPTLHVRPPLQPIKASSRKTPATAGPRPRRIPLHTSINRISICNAKHAALVAGAVPQELEAVAEEIALLQALAVAALCSSVEEAAAVRVLEFAAAA